MKVKFVFHHEHEDAKIPYSVDNKFENTILDLPYMPVYDMVFQLCDFYKLYKFTDEEIRRIDLGVEGAGVFSVSRIVAFPDYVECDLKYIF